MFFNIYCYIIFYKWYIPPYARLDVCVTSLNNRRETVTQQQGHSCRIRTSTVRTKQWWEIVVDKNKSSNFHSNGDVGSIVPWDRNRSERARIQSPLLAKVLGGKEIVRTHTPDPADILLVEIPPVDILLEQDIHLVQILLVGLDTTQTVDRDIDGVPEVLALLSYDDVWVASW